MGRFAGASLVVEKMNVKNEGWQLDVVEDFKSVSAAAALRGFVLRKSATREVQVSSGVETISE